MSAEKFIGLQHQMRQNQSELQDFLADLDQWSSDIKNKDEKLKTTESESIENKKLPPIRNSLQKKKQKKKKNKHKKELEVEKENKRISGYDFQAWDKFDVDKACQDVDKDESKDTSSEYETDEEWEELRMKQQANLLKDQGNHYFKEGKFDEAIECYTQGISIDPTNALLPANRAMALLKLKRYGAAELDCSLTISLDPTYIKAYQRRGSARLELKKLKEAKDDFLQVLQLEANNKLAKVELEKIDKLMNPPQFSMSTDGDAGVVKPIYKPPKDRSKKPLRRLVIEEVGMEEEEDKRRLSEGRGRSLQSATAQRLTDQGAESFQRLVNKQAGQSPADIVCSNTTREPQEIAQSNIVQESNVTHNSKSVTNVDNTQNSDLSIDLSKLEGREERNQCTNHSTNLSVSAIGSPQTSPRVPPVPNTSYQFQADWKVLKNTNQQFFEYFKEIEHKSYMKLFGQFLDADVLNKIITTLRDFYVPHGLSVIPVLQNLTSVKRFSMTVMFLSAAEKSVIREVFKQLTATSSTDAALLSELMKQYDL